MVNKYKFFKHFLAHPHQKSTAKRNSSAQKEGCCLLKISENYLLTSLTASRCER